MERTSGAGRSSRDGASRPPFRILVLGDFGGRGGRVPPETGRALARRRPVRVDRDVLQELPSRLGTALAPDAGTTLRFETVEDFRPEGIAERMPGLRALRDLRARLLEARTAGGAAEEARRLLGELDDAPPAAPAGKGDVRSAAPVSSEGLLDALLDSTSARTSDDDAAERLVREVAAPGVEKLRLPRAPSDRDALAAALEARLGEGLRKVLLAPEFRALEATWRGLEFLVRRAETSPDLQIHVFDVSRDELTADVGVAGNLEDGGIHRIVVAETVETPDAAPWTLVVAPFAFDAVPRDVATLLRLARISAAAGAVCLAGADGRVVGCPSLARAPEPEDWTAPPDPVGDDLYKALRRVPEAAHLALLWPPFLVRAPYGPGREDTEGFSFDETAGTGAGDASLLGSGAWANPAWAAAAVFVRAFGEHGWDLADGVDPEIHDLPAVVVGSGGDQELAPAVGARLTSRAADRIRARGVVPLVPFRDQASVRLGRLDSIADPPRPLAGRWD